MYDLPHYTEHNIINLFCSHHGYWFWIPIVATKIGAVLGGFTYLILVEVHHTEDF